MLLVARTLTKALRGPAHPFVIQARARHRMVLTALLDTLLLAVLIIGRRLWPSNGQLDLRCRHGPANDSARMDHETRRADVTLNLCTCVALYDLAGNQVAHHGARHDDASCSNGPQHATTSTYHHQAVRGGDVTYNSPIYAQAKLVDDHVAIDV